MKKIILAALSGFALFALTSCGGFNADGVTVSLDETDKPNWVEDVSVVNGEIVLDIIPAGLTILFR